MVLVHLMGGIGNQMFQYAAGKALATRLNVPLKVYFSDHYPHATRSFALDVFALPLSFPSPEELKNYLPAKGIARRWKKMVGLPYTGKLYREQTLFELDKGFFEIQSGVYLSGFWQNRKYFDQIESSLRHDFEFKEELSGMNLDAKRSMQQHNHPVSVHIRRSDYLNLASGLYPLPLEYYQKAIEMMESRLQRQAFYYLFSDDPAWVKEHFSSLPGDRFFVMSQNDTRSAQDDLHLMATCQHHIIANSSFSWWGAWLNSSSDKITIGPRHWMRNNTAAQEALFTEKDVLL